jgi:hypothetical protein
MKSAYELAMERLSKTSPTAKLSDKQKKQIAELESKYKAKIAELVSDRKSLLNELEEKKEKVRGTQ